MGRYNFNKKRAVRSLIRCGFYLKKRKGRKHEKWFPSIEIANRLLPDQCKFIMMPRHNELHLQEDLIDELRQMGGEELVAKFLANL
jgi:hypothetical protein